MANPLVQSEFHLYDWLNPGSGLFGAFKPIANGNAKPEPTPTWKPWPTLQTLPVPTPNPNLPGFWYRPTKPTKPDYEEDFDEENDNMYIHSKNQKKPGNTYQKYPTM